jgi:hypothetical protein
MKAIEASPFPPSLPIIVYRKKISHRRAQQSGTVRRVRACNRFTLLTLNLAEIPPFDHSNRARVCPLLGNSGQRWILARDGLSAFDPSATLAVHCGNGFDAGFSPHQSACLSR